MKSSGSLLIGWDFSHGKDNCVLLVGEKKNGQAVDIINAFKGEEARELLGRLLPEKEKNNDQA